MHLEKKFKTDQQRQSTITVIWKFISILHIRDAGCSSIENEIITIYHISSNPFSHKVSNITIFINSRTIPGNSRKEISRNGKCNLHEGDGASDGETKPSTLALSWPGLGAYDTLGLGDRSGDNLKVGPI